MSRHRDLPESMVWRIIGGAGIWVNGVYSLTARHRVTRKRWDVEHVDSIQSGGSKVLFTEESRFSLECDARRSLVWRKRGTRNNHIFIQERLHDKQGALILWAGIIIGGRNELHIIRVGNLEALRYADKILKPLVVLCAAGIGDSFLLMQDNSRRHTTRLMENFLEDETVQRIE
ncbi:transposable element Tcb2 transposase [Trichonephila clavipes]|nr:transposable element Tcb2 transposase [Trichonephila clavipes]